MALQVERIDRHDRRALHRFVTFPWRVYAGDPHWVPPLIGDEKKKLTHHPFLEHAEVDCFLALRDGRIAGRIAAIENRIHNEVHGERVAFFGFFEALDDPEAARALFAAAEAWAAARGLSALRGPASFSSNEEWALLVDGFDSPPVVMMTYNPRRYVALLESCGFRKAKDVLAYYLDNPDPPERVLRAAEKLAARRGVTVRPLDLKRYDAEVGRIREVYNRAWEKNWGFVPMTEAEIAHLAKEMRPAVKPDLVLIAEQGGAPVGFAVALPDVNVALRHANGRLFPFGLLKILWIAEVARRIDMLRVPMLGLVPEVRGLGIDQLLYLRLFQGGRKLRIVRGEFSWILEDNLAMRQALEKIGARAYKTYRIYEKEVSPAP
jgi:GNAT superfamily N-acetyltransferase